ncbi:related to Nascent polypeptide-associated complex subunit alpha [Saccharomycodes ludwigii]|uniref:Nascent polypeptide-associated complex subunit alpha n=1 Tax=Saccharomycodes ludwigii TaxID=36035 RepID=A0A376B9U6_9ASCO|nr:hypothetical protein SCDLUD_004368 [Saccharomycodes ludwigii]KAH3900050.1 hypothetical protein SCDLUD_004368 [Saccharomycodes ludwigii]SSD61381.1 related to Nascent polypeptide-associated complex subunit alpha [Saccharomycodes ludwigii]
MSTSTTTVFNKNEKKARELISKLNLKQVPGVTRVTFRKKDNQIFSIDKPDVYRSPAGNYVVFGECKLDNFQQRLAQAQSLAQEKPASEEISKDPASIQADLAAAANEADNKVHKEVKEEDLIDESELDPESIDLVVQQTKCTKEEAILGLRRNKGDLVNTILALSK